MSTVPLMALETFFADAEKAVEQAAVDVSHWVLATAQTGHPELASALTVYRAGRDLHVGLPPGHPQQATLDTLEYGGSQNGPRGVFANINAQAPVTLAAAVAAAVSKVSP